MNLPIRQRLLRHMLAAALSATAVSIAIAPAAQAGGVELKTAFAGPIAASSALCTAEPRGYIYGTTNYDPSKPLTFTSKYLPGYGAYEPPNAPSWLDLAPAGIAGGHADLCAGVTLTPDVEPLMMRDDNNLTRPRIPDDPAWPDVADTHVGRSGGTTPVGDDASTLAVDLPAGYTADLSGIAACTTTAFGAGTYAAAACPDASQVGDAFVRLSGYTTALFHTPATGIKLFALAHTADEFARIGLSLTPTPGLAPIKLVARVVLAADNSGRLELVFSGLPRVDYKAADIADVGTQWTSGDTITDPTDPRVGQPVPTAAATQLYLEGVSVRLWGGVAAHPGLPADVGSWGSRCDNTIGGDASATTYNQADVTSTVAAAAVSISGCSDLQLPATAAFSTTEHAADTPTGATLTVQLPQPTGTLLPALARSVRVRLPDGVEPGIQFAADTAHTAACTAPQFGAGTIRVASACPVASQIGTAQIQTSLSGDAFSGAMYLGPPIASAADSTATNLASILIDATTPGGATADAPRIKLAGQLIVAPGGGTTIAFDDLPALRIKQLQVAFAAGETALFTTPTTCGSSVGSVGLQSGGAGPATTVPFSLGITSSCEHPTAASLALTGTTTGSGGRDATGFTITRSAGDAPITGATVTLPPGELLTQFTGVPCDSEATRESDCPDRSHLGSVRLTAGPRAAQATLTGGLYLATTPDDDALAGALLIANATSAGGVDLGRLVAPGRFDLLPGGTLSMTVTLPKLLGGARLALRSLAVDLDDQRNVVAPTACGPLAASATVTSSDGTGLTGEATATYPGCASRAFEPSFVAGAPIDASGHARVALAVSARAGDASLRSIAVTMPSGLSVDKTTAGRTCSAEQFSGGACPQSSRVGSAGEELSTGPDSIPGDLYAIAAPGQALPGIGIAYAGRYAHRVAGQLSTTPDGRIALSVPSMPDLPLGRVTLTFDAGAAGLFTRGTTGCDATRAWTATFGGQGGQSVARTAPTTCATVIAPTTPATKAKKATPSHLEFSISPKTGLKLKMNGFGGRTLQSAKLTLPKALRFNTKVVKRKKQVAVVVLGAKSKTSFTGGSLLLLLTGGPAQEAVVRVRATAYVTATAKGRGRASAVKNRGKLETFRLRLGFADGSFEVRTATAHLG